MMEDLGKKKEKVFPRFWSNSGFQFFVFLIYLGTQVFLSRILGLPRIVSLTQPDLGGKHKVDQINQYLRIKFSTT